MSVIPVFISFISVAVRPSHNMRIRMKSPHRPGISLMVFFCGTLPVVFFLRSSSCGPLPVVFFLRSSSCGPLPVVSFLRSPSCVLPVRTSVSHAMAVCTQPLTYAFCSSSSFTPNRALSVVPPRSRSALFRQTWHTHPCQRPLQGLPPFQVCAFSTDLAHSPLSETAPGPVPVPGLRFFDRPGTPTPRRAASVACPRSRSAPFQQTWHTRPCQRPLQGLSPFQVCILSTDLERMKTST